MVEPMLGPLSGQAPLVGSFIFEDFSRRLKRLRNTFAHTHPRREMPIECRGVKAGRRPPRERRRAAFTPRSDPTLGEGPNLGSMRFGP
jgi:hypothetical protein